jgi:hypothetical protein
MLANLERHRRCDDGDAHETFGPRDLLHGVFSLSLPRARRFRLFARVLRVDTCSLRNAGAAYKATVVPLLPTTLGQAFASVSAWRGTQHLRALARLLPAR